MHWKFALISFILPLGTVIAIFFAYLGWLRRRERNAKAFILLMLAIGIWSFSYTMEQFTPTLREKIFWHKMSYLGIPYVPLMWFIFNAQRMKLKFARRSGWLVAVALVPILMSIVTLTLDRHDWVWGELSLQMHAEVSHLQLERKPEFFIFVSYSYLLLCAGTFFYLLLLWRSPTLRLQTIVILSAAVALPFVLNILRIVFNVNPFQPYDLTPIALTTTGTTAGWVTFRFGLLDILSLARSTLLESMSDGVIVIDRSGRIASINRSAQRMFQKSAETAMGKPLQVLLPEISRCLPALVNGDNIGGEMTAEPRDGAGRTAQEIVISKSEAVDDQMFIDLSISYLYDHGQRLTGMLLVLRDITQRKKTQQALVQAQRVESIGLLAGGVAHDFNNLLASIAMRHQLALTALPAASPARRHLDVAKKIVERAADLTRQLLAYAGKGDFKVELLDLNQLIRENEAILETAVPKQICLALDLSPVPLTVKADQGQLQQVIMNLVLNAVDAIHEESGSIEVTTGLCHLAAGELDEYVWKGRARAGKYVHLTVRDSGVGMDEEVQSRIFDLFFTTKTNRRGLGLSALLGIMHTCGGAVSVQSRPGFGTTFRAVFPASSEPPPAVQALNAHALRTVSNLQGTLLIVDDENLILEALTELFQEMGFQVFTAQNGQQAVELFHTRAPQIDLILLDTQMPVMGGFATLKLLRDHDSGIPVLLSSGYSQTAISSSIDWDERTDFIQKPYELDQLLKKVESMLVQKQGANPISSS